MKNLLKTFIVGIIGLTSVSFANAEDLLDSEEYNNAYTECSNKADQQADDASWNTVFGDCMTEKGYSAESESDATASPEQELNYDEQE